MGGFAEFGNDLYTGKRSIDFVGRRRLWYSIALVAMALSVVALAVRGLNEGIEFKGGSEFRISKTSTQSETTGIDAVHTVVPSAEVKVTKVDHLGQRGIRVQTDRLTLQQSDQVVTAVAKAYGVPPDEVSTSFVGPTWGADVSNKAWTGLIVFVVLVSLLIALYFRTWTMALSAVLALLHDLLLTVGVYALVGFEVTPASVIGFLTILGYSLYDTVVVFDKVRENTDHVLTGTKRTFGEAANLAINQTLVRSINTSVVALLPVAAILFIGAFLLGAGTLKDISLALFVGIAAGTYSSIFIATPLLVQLRERDAAVVAHTQKVLRRRAETPGAESAGGAGPVEGGGAAGEADSELAAAAAVGGTGQRVQPKRTPRSKRS